jgi:hypothetical protein
VGQAEARTDLGRARDLRAAAISAIRGGPMQVLPAVVAALVVATSCAVLILTVASDSGPQPALNEWVRGVAAGLCATIGLGYLGYRLLWVDADTARRSTSASGAALVTGLLSLAVLTLLLLVPVYLLAARTHPPTEQWIGYGFFDKRWLLATFLLGTLGAMIVITAVSQLVRAAATAPTSWRAWGKAAFGSAAEPDRGGVGIRISSARRAALVAGGLAIAAYFFGPPWHVALSPVNLHEAPMMSGVQAMANGTTPYIGSAAVQYGPGSELIHYLYLHLFGFNVVSFRQSTVFLYWLAASIFFVVIFIRLPLKLAVITCLVSVLLFPTLQMISFQPNGSVDGAVDRLYLSSGGFWGWPNAMRYIGVFALAMLFPAVATRHQGAWTRAVALGVLFGFSCYVSQENLVGGILVVGGLALLLAVSKTVPVRMLIRAVIGVAAGFASVAMVVLGYYAANGELSRFLQLYYLIPPAVAAGYSDTVYYGGFAGQWGHVYFLLPFFLGFLCVLSVVQLHPLRIAQEWSRERVLLVSALVAACVSQTGAMLRADSAHLVNTMLALPVALVLAVAYLPGLLGLDSSRRRLTTAVALAAIPLALLPYTQIRNIGDRLSWPVERFSHHDQAIQWQRANPSSVAAARLGPVLHAPEQWCCTHFRYPVSMREFASILNRLHSVVGDRRVYVANFIDPMNSGAAYFLADLKPAPVFFDQQTMAMNEHLLGNFLDYFRDHISNVQAVVAVYPKLAEVQMFKAAYPNYRRTELPYTWGTVTVLTR